MTVEAKRTRDHEKIRRWVEERGGEPATVGGTERTGQKAGLLRIEFPGGRNRKAHMSLKKISWDKFFQKFDDKGLVFLYQDKTATGRTSRFAKFVSGESRRARKK